jgi:hypothetical protein
VTTCCEGSRHSPGAHSHTAGAEWTIKHVHAESGLRLYRGIAESHSILAKDGRPDHRIPAHPA